MSPARPAPPCPSLTLTCSTSGQLRRRRSTIKPHDSPNSSARNCEAGEQLLEVIIEDGTVHFIHDDDLYQLLAPAFQLETFRASHVEPTADGRWEVDVAPLIARKTGVAPGRTVIAVTDRRDEALAAEALWVRNYLSGSLSL
jgi:hypothetical protein